MALYDLILGPFLEFGFMRRALMGCIALSISGAPIGVFLVLRRMSLMGDVMAHAILPGAAIGFLLSGFSLFAMTSPARRRCARTRASPPSISSRWGSA